MRGTVSLLICFLGSIFGKVDARRVFFVYLDSSLYDGRRKEGNERKKEGRKEGRKEGKGIGKENE